jgi:hemerythrin-like metal-binding protein
MEKIIWYESYSVGIKEIDKQHKKLIELINQLIEAKGVSVRSEIISNTLTEMTNYAIYHFQAEEELMRQHQYPQYDVHHKAHMEFVRKTAEMATETIELNRAVPEVLLSYLKSWLISHILKSDMAYKDFFRDRDVT